LPCDFSANEHSLDERLAFRIRLSIEERYQGSSHCFDEPLDKAAFAMFASIFFVVFGAAVGVLLAARRYPAPALAPVAAFIGSAAMVSGILVRHAPETIAIAVLLSTRPRK
jgi:hypothetical protein